MEKILCSACGRPILIPEHRTLRKHIHCTHRADQTHAERNMTLDGADYYCTACYLEPGGVPECPECGRDCIDFGGFDIPADEA